MMATNLYSQIEQSIEPLRSPSFDIQVRGPDKLSEIDGESANERMRNAAAAADAANADVLLFGRLNYASGVTTMLPEIYIRPQRFPGGDEATGYELLGDPIPVSDDIRNNTAAAALLTEDVAKQATSWVQLAVGLGYFRLGRYTDAASHLSQALNGGVPNSQRNKLLNLYLANVANEQHALPEAAALADQALALDPTYARAALGKAQSWLRLIARQRLQRRNH
ncbi:MAG: hypothetical protein IPK16_13655 [Anaerolineales bacterium]|nr:hypothetical protein [Anaerolineales bacterium]